MFFGVKQKCDSLVSKLTYGHAASNLPFRCLDNLHHKEEAMTLVSDVEIAPNKRYSSFMPSLEDEGQF